MHLWMRCLSLLAGALMFAWAHAEPFVPHDGSLVILHVSTDPLVKRVAALEADARKSPADTSRIYEAADALIELGRRTSEPRYFGRAETLILQRLKAVPAASELRLQLADILQYRHEFDSALQQLSQVLQVEPLNPRAHLMRGAIQQAAGRFDEARHDCTTVLAGGDTFAGTVCLAQSLGMTGHVSQALALIARLDTTSGATPARYTSWMLGVRADLQDRTGDIRGAEESLRAAVALNRYDFFARLTLADLLLRERRYADVTPLLSDVPQSESVLLRIAEAQRGLAAQTAAVVLTTLTDRVTAASARGERIHLRDLARLELRLLGDAAAALQIAQQNWIQQRESADARLLIECARAAGDRSVIAAVVAWQKRIGYEDAVIDDMLKAPHPPLSPVRRKQ